MSSFLVLFLLLGANAYEDLFTQGNNAYQTGNYSQAIQHYEQLAAAQVAAPEVFYNLGNAYYRFGKLGHAIANYERALHLNPRLEQAQENLQKALRDTDRNLARPLSGHWEQALFFWQDRIPLGVLVAMAVISWLGCWVLLSLRAYRPYPYLRRAAALLAVLALLTSWPAWNRANPTPLAVAIDKSSVHFGQNDTDTVRFELFAGDRVRVDRREAGWARVTTVSGERGWTRQENLLFVGPPYETPPEFSTAAHAPEMNF